MENKKDLNQYIEELKNAIVNIQALGYKVTFEDEDAGYGDEGFAVMRKIIKTYVYHERTNFIGQTYDKEVSFYTCD